MIAWMLTRDSAASGVLGKINAHFFGANMGLLLSQKLNEEEVRLGEIVPQGQG